MRSTIDIPETPSGQVRSVIDDGAEFIPPTFPGSGGEDTKVDYLDSFLPIFYDRLSLITKRVMADCVKAYGLSGVHATYLVALSLREGQTLVELSRFLDIDAANTNRVVKALKECGLAYDDRPSPNSKKFSIYLTEEGEELAAEILSRTRESMNSLFRGIPKFSIDNMRYTVIKMLYNADPGLEDYVDSKWVNPFFAYLSLGWEENDPNTLKFGREGYEGRLDRH